MPVFCYKREDLVFGLAVLGHKDIDRGRHLSVPVSFILIRACPARLARRRLSELPADLLRSIRLRLSVWGTLGHPQDVSGS